MISGLQASLASARASADGARVKELEDRIASLKAQLKKAHTMVRNQQDTVTDALMIGATRALRSALTQLEAHSNGTGMAACFTVWARLALGQGMSERKQQLLQLQQQQRQQQQLMESTHSMLQQERAAAESARAQVAALSKQLREERLSREGAPAVTMNEGSTRDVQVGAPSPAAIAAQAEALQAKVAAAEAAAEAAMAATYDPLVTPFASARRSQSVASAVRAVRAATAVEGDAPGEAPRALEAALALEDVAEATHEEEAVSSIASSVRHHTFVDEATPAHQPSPARAPAPAACAAGSCSSVRVAPPSTPSSLAPIASVAASNGRAAVATGAAGIEARRSAARSTADAITERQSMHIRQELMRLANLPPSMAYGPGAYGAPSLLGARSVWKPGASSRHIAPGQLTSPAMRTASAMLLARVS